MFQSTFALGSRFWQLMVHQMFQVRVTVDVAGHMQ